MLLGRAMNPIYTILNPEENSEEILDGMHRITTATDFLNNKFKINGKFLTNDEFKVYDKKYFKELKPDEQAKIRNYNFIFNNLDSSYRTNINKRRDMYEILNRSSKTLNDYEFNKVLYNSFYDIISKYKDSFNEFFKKKDLRGEIETEIISLIVLSDELPKSWGSINILITNFLENIIGTTEESVSKYLIENTDKVKEKLDLIEKIMERLVYENVFSKDKKIFNKYYLPYKFFICRLYFKLQNISIFNRHIEKIIEKFKKEISTIDIQKKLDCKSRNAIFQKKLIQLIESIIDSEYHKSNPVNNRLFDKKIILEKLKEQGNKCNLCKKDVSGVQYEGDHIIPWSKNGKTEYSNLQILCIYCHNKK
jgi:hypothetical protein